MDDSESSVGEALVQEANDVLAAYDGDGVPGALIFWELRLCLRAFRAALSATHSGDMLSVWLNARLLIESSVRLSWVASEGGATNRDALLGRLRRLGERDLSALVRADGVVRETLPGARLHIDLTDVDALLADASPAPRTVRSLAEEAGTAWLYGLYAMASTIIHPGIYSGADRYELHPPDDARVSIHLPFAGAVMAAAALLKLAQPETTPPSVTHAVGEVRRTLGMD
jgi:hypothetical protein